MLRWSSQEEEGFHMRLAFLLGSGVSVAAGLPSTAAITDRVLTGEGVGQHTNETYYFDPRCDVQPVQTIRTLLRELRKDAEPFYQRRLSRGTNYEDLYYLADQIHGTVYEEYENPGVWPFVDRILQRCQPVTRSENELGSLANESCHYIRDVAWRLLARDVEDLSHLRALVDACRDTSFAQIDIFTLNHDTLIEQSLRETAVNFCDGFDDQVKNARYWTPELFKKPTHVRLLKLHGSINWFRYGIRDRTTFAMPVPLDSFEHLKDEEGAVHYPEGFRPEMLIGTFNKMLDYSRAIFGDVFCLFRHILRESDRLIVSGYSFGDKGVNTQVVHWLQDAQGRQMIVIHPDRDELLRNARGAIRKNWHNWNTKGQLIFIQGPFESVSWTQLRKAIL